jgi:hypothetical protein
MPTSFRNTVPPGNPLDVKSLAGMMRLASPVNLSTLLGDLVPPTSVAFSSGTLGYGTEPASGGAVWIVTPQGNWTFSGTINNGSALSTNYAFGMALNVKDSNGNAIGVTHSGSVGPNVPLGNNNDSWNDSGFDQRIISLWPAIFGATASSKLNLSTNPVGVVEEVLLGLGLVAGLAVGAILGGSHLKCTPPASDIYRDSTGAPGVAIKIS